MIPLELRAAVCLFGFTHVYLLVQVRCLSGSDSGLGKAHVGVPVDVGMHQFSDHRAVLRDERFDVFVVSVHHLVRHYALTTQLHAQESGGIPRPLYICACVPLSFADSANFVRDL